MDDPKDFPRQVLYRHAHGEATRWSEIRWFNNPTGKDFVRSGRSRDERVETILRGLENPPDPADMEAIKDGIEDDIEGRRPRW
jgi:hypothetical protein